MTDYIVELFTNYYGIDLLAFIFVLIHLKLLGDRKRLGWIFGFFSVCCFTIFGVLSESGSTILFNLFFAIMHLRNYFKWRTADVR